MHSIQAIYSFYKEYIACIEYSLAPPYVNIACVCLPQALDGAIEQNTVCHLNTDDSGI